MSNPPNEEMAAREPMAAGPSVQQFTPTMFVPSMSIKVRETVCPQPFIEENKEWLEKLLQPDQRIEVMPHVFRAITKDTIRILPSLYNDALYKLFRDVGDRERSEWCLQEQVAMMVIARDHPIPERPDKRFFMGQVERLWMIGHMLNCAGNPHGRELERISWELRAFMAFFGRQQVLAQNARAQAQAQARARAEAQAANQQQQQQQQQPST